MPLVAQLKLPAGVVHVAHVGVGFLLTHIAGDRHLDDHAVGLLHVIVDAEGQRVVEEAEVETEVGLLAFLPAQVFVGQVVRLRAVDHAGLLAEVVVVVATGSGLGAEAEVGNVVNTVLTPAGAQLQVRQPVAGGLHELLVDDVPASRHRGERTVFLVRAEARATVAAHRGLQHVALVEVVADAAEERAQAMLHIGAAPCAHETLRTRHLAVGIGGQLQVTARGVVKRGLGGVHQIPVRATQLVALRLQGALSEHHADGVLAELLVIGQRVLHLPARVVALVGRGRGVVGVVVARKIVLLQRGSIVAPERQLGAVGKVVLQCIPQLQVERELRHELVAPVLRGVALHHGDGVVLLLIAADEVGHGIGVAVGIQVHVVLRILVDHALADVGIAVLIVATAQRDGQRGSQIEGRAER